MENAAIWQRHWVGIGFDAGIPNAGDVLPGTVGDHGIHVERMSDGGLRGRFNKAQHGGCRMVPLQCQTGAKTRCSFTACGHSRDRKPVGASDPDRVPQLDQYFGLRPERLLPVAVRLWGPVIQVRLDPTMSSVLGKLDSEAQIEQDGLVTDGDTLWREFPGNWKDLAVALAVACPSESTCLLFPNVSVLRAGDLTTIIVLQPIALHRTLCRVRFFGHGERPSVTAVAASIEVLDRQVEQVEVEADPPREAHHHASRFHADVLAAIDLLDAESNDSKIFQTQMTGAWS